MERIEGDMKNKQKCYGLWHTIFVDDCPFIAGSLYNFLVKIIREIDDSPGDGFKKPLETFYIGHRDCLTIVPEEDKRDMARRLVFNLE